LGDLLLVIVIRLSGALQAEFSSPNFVQPIHYLVLQVFNFVFKNGDLGGEPVSEDLLVLDCPRKHINFDWSCESGSLLLVKICFHVRKALDAKSEAPTIMPRSISWFLNSAKRGNDQSIITQT
jgi:hypothetical protein